MDTTHPVEDISLRPATQADARTIREIISSVNINPMGLSWQRFILAVDQAGKIIGCGQLKPHADGTSELASIAVLPEWRGKGVARRIIEHLLDNHPGRLYLTCRSQLEPLYQKFGFQLVMEAEMPPYFKRISKIAALFNKLFRLPDHLLVMYKD
jgi:N-acetylglutamate synthase-like GNAT family acetyltransferase